MSDYDPHTISRVTLDRRTLVGPMSDRETVLDALFADGFRIVQSGPYTDAKMFPRMDIQRFRFVVEREVPAPPDQFTTATESLTTSVNVPAVRSA